MKCPECSFENSDDFKFCGECGYKFDLSLQKENFQGERKHATILFSDLSGYTAMTEKMDPEDVKNLMEDIFEKAGKIAEKYQGTVDSFFGDEILVLFGVPKANEDDPIRAIHAAIEIHKMVKELSPEFEKQNFAKLSMHTGIDTGLVITGDKFIGKGRQGLTGDTVNLASRLTGLAKSGEIVIGEGAYKIAKNHFSFEARDPVKVKGKRDPVHTFQVIEAARKPKKTKQLHGVRAELICRDKELSIFNKAVTDLKNGKGSVLCLYGFAGTGKSRLVEEFRAITSVQWFEGYTFPYTRNIPYFPLLTLFDDAFKIKEEDSSKILREKIEKSINALIKDSKDIIPYIGTLYSLSYPEVETVSPEFWKSKLFDAVLEILSALSKQQPIIVCIEDLHWADHSFLELIDFIQSKANLPIFFLYIARPIIKIFSDSQKEQIKTEYQEIRIEDLSASDSQVMVKSLLNSEDIPSGLKSFVETKTQGNPFYLEEMINSLIESKVLLKTDNEWVLEREITESDISSSIHGVIAARVDRLESESKRILQEASVIGKSFYYEIINKITRIKKDINLCLETLEGFDLIKSQESKIDLEYMFKHALTQEVVYNGLLKADRQVIHEKIGLVIEQIFDDRLSEFYETLAHHFSKGKSTLKAVDYLMKSGDKSLKIYSVEESHQYYQQAFDLLNRFPEKNVETNEIMIDLLNKWALVYYYSGETKKAKKLFSSQEHLIDQINDKEKIGMFYAWQGNILWMSGQYIKAKESLKKAEKIGIEINSKKVIGYACTWLSWVCGDLGLFEDGIEYGQRANEIGKNLKKDHYVYFKSLGGIGNNYFYMGHASGSIKAGEKMIKYGNRHSQIRSLSLGHFIKSLGYVNSGDFANSVIAAEQSIAVSADPFYTLCFNIMLTLSYILNRNTKKAKGTLDKLLPFCEKNGCEFIRDMGIVCNGLILVEQGKMSEGLKIIKDAEQLFISQQRKGALLTVKLILGKVYLEIIQKTKPISFLTIIKNLGFIIKNVPSADKKAIYHYTQTIDFAKEIGAIGIKAQAHLDLGIIHKIKKRNDLAKKHLQKAINIFEEIGAFKFLKQANKELKQLTNKG